MYKFLSINFSVYFKINGIEDKSQTQAQQHQNHQIDVLITFKVFKQTSIE